MHTLAAEATGKGHATCRMEGLAGPDQFSLQLLNRHAAEILSLHERL